MHNSLADQGKGRNKCTVRSLDPDSFVFRQPVYKRWQKRLSHLKRLSSERRTRRISPSSETSQERNMLRQLAVALAADGEALSAFVGSTIKNKEGKESFNPSILRSQAWIAVLTTSLTMSRATARRIGSRRSRQRFLRLINELQAVCRPDRWRGKRHSRESTAIRSYTYEDQIPTLTLIST